ncbi:Uncharacterised protein [Vibrio cholerae]|nr:Uncharacterised protein [Vibrio cholerae]CSI56410.1 Uncharacterised protein [Vibrio cholerae]
MGDGLKRQRRLRNRNASKDHSQHFRHTTR